MGLYERDYYRDEARNQATYAGPQSMVVKIILINGALYLANILLGIVTGREDNWLTQTLSLQADVVDKPWLWWKFLTYGFAHSPKMPMHILGNMFALWIFGSDLEELYGRRRFLRIYLTSIVLGGVCWGCRQFWMQPAELPRAVLDLIGLRGASLMGASGGVTTMTILYAVNFPRRTIYYRFFIPLPAWVVGVLTIVGDLLQISGPGIAYDVHLVGAAYALVFHLFGRKAFYDLERPWSFTAWAKKFFRRRPKLRLHRPEPDESDVSYDNLEVEADRILGKIHTHGEDSLTPRERRVMEEYSRRMRRKHSPR